MGLIDAAGWPGFAVIWHRACAKGLALWARLLVGPSEHLTARAEAAQRAGQRHAWLAAQIEERMRAGRPRSQGGPWPKR
ncbi:hypothetical protein [Methylovirgula sp. 4M-Z18]|uniref:hypothetical protein n=1 Tax=Methylovirgula sp. 4M-Z18 TaxID=2293567 RepID=UPI000E2E73E8|nr:hypothetical protein [Methylovirgula sp. 4M-Z18]RFB80424.1 hypothetical protein DYH55_02530 [Methylovirgula sp. 4M-Z18]